jgi:hypothetical protein
MISEITATSLPTLAFLVFTALILVCLMIGLFLLWRIARVLSRLTAPSLKDRLSAIEERTWVTEQLIVDPKHKRLLVRYFLAEAGLQSRLADIEDTVVGFRETDFDERDAEAIVDAIAKALKWPANWWQSGREWLGRNKGEIAKALLGKLNDLVKSAVGGGGRT